MGQLPILAVYAARLVAAELQVGMLEQVARLLLEQDDRLPMLEQVGRLPVLAQVERLSMLGQVGRLQVLETVGRLSY